MTVFAAIKAAVLRTIGAQISQAFASSEQIAVEMTDLANEVATDILESHDWRALAKVAEITGTGALEYPLPADYDRMILSAEIDDRATWFWGYEPFESVNDWMRFKSGAYGVLSPGGWIILDGQIQFFPAPSGVAQYPYISSHYARSEAGVTKASFTADNDTFRLPERLLTLGLIWRWMDQKGLQYSEALATYEKALEQQQSRDKGARVIRTPRRHFNVNRAYAGGRLG
ncbi:MAG: hypothetical protein QM523_01050 [Candidatus Pacebacteria bacterium]|nr:hypothetical protein [Candidatus Paceibacterota bacterium]